MSEGQGCKQAVPRGENKEDCNGSQPFEEATACSCLVDGLEPNVIGEFSNGVEGEGQQVEGGEDGGQVLLAVSEIVFEVIALCFQDVEAFVFDLPARPSAGRQFDDGVAVGGQVSDEAVAIGHLAGGVANLDHQPVDRHGVG